MKLPALRFFQISRQFRSGGLSRSLPLFSVVALISLLLTGCADGEGERRFANDPLPTEDVLAPPTPPAATRIVLPTQSPAVPINPAELLTNTGPATNTFVIVGSRIDAIPADGSESTTITELIDLTLIAHGWSANGERLAILAADKNGAALTVRILDKSGKTLTELPLSDNASPIPAGYGLYRITWSPTNDKILLSLGTGGLIEVSEAGARRTILSPESAPSPRAIAWSPDGSAIAWVDAGVAGNATGLYVASTDALPVDPVTVIRPIEGRSRQIVEIAWGTGAAGIVYAERAPGGDLSIGGDLFAVSPSGGQPDLIATAGGVTQVGAIGSFAISPDGDSVIYSVIEPVPNGVAIRRLTLRQIKGPSSFDLPSAPGAMVEDFMWTSQGAVWTVRPVDDGQDRPVVQVAIADGSVKTLFEVPADATPVASPNSIASPVALPPPVVTSTPTP